MMIWRHPLNSNYTKLFQIIDISKTICQIIEGDFIADSKFFFFFSIERERPDKRLQVISSTNIVKLLNSLIILSGSQFTTSMTPRKQQRMVFASSRTYEPRGASFRSRNEQSSRAPLTANPTNDSVISTSSP